MRERTNEVEVERDVKVTVSDGTVLLADVYHPVGVDDAPTILERTPYGRTNFASAMGPEFAGRGYRYVLQACRGTDGSGGTHSYFAEAGDGRDTADWIAAQPWFNGSLGTFGGSYMGFTQWALASTKPPHLKAMAVALSTSVRSYSWYPGRLAGPRGDHPLGRRRDPVQQADQRRAHHRHLPGGHRAAHGPAEGRLRPPASRRGDRPAHRRRPAAVPGPARSRRRGRWLLGPGELPAPAGGMDGADPAGRRLARLPAARRGGGLRRPTRLAGPGASAHRRRRTPGRGRGGRHDRRADGLVRHLVARPGGTARPHPGQGPRAGRRRALARPGRTGRLPREPTRWYLHAGGRLAPMPPDAPSEPDRYRYDPADPTPSMGGIGMLTGGTVDNRPLEARPDVLVYTSDELVEPLELIGPVEAELQVGSSLDHTDFFVRVCDVSPDGRSVNVCDGLQRFDPASIRRNPDGTFTAGVAVWPVGHTFAAGHRLRVQVSSGAHPVYARNLGTGEPPATATTLRAAEQAVYHEPGRLSWVTLPHLSG